MSIGNSIKDLCKERKIAVSRLEKDLGFSNGYIRKLGDTIPLDRATKIAEYLNVEIDCFDIEETKKQLEETPKVFDIDKELNDLIRKINISDQIAFSGEAVPSELSDTSKTLFLMSIKTILEQQKHLAEQE